MWAVVGGAAAAFAFPIVAVGVWQARERRRNRRAGRRRTDKIRLTPEPGEGADG